MTREGMEGLYMFHLSLFINQNKLILKIFFNFEIPPTFLYIFYLSTIF